MQPVSHGCRTGRVGIPPPEIQGQSAHSSTPCENSRWQAVDLTCDDGETERVIRTKLVRDESSAAMCVAEAIGHCTMDAVGLPVADAYAVQVSEEFAGQLEDQYDFEQVRSGPHWGTVLNTRAVNVELAPYLVEDLENPERLFTLYLADVLLGTPDRNTSGNVLFSSDAGRDGLTLIPIDQSDCFDHPRTLRDPENLEEARTETLADDPNGMGSALLDVGQEFLEEEFRRVRARRDDVLECVREPHGEWYDRSGVSRETVREFLAYRFEHLEELARMDHWREMIDFTGGADVLDL